MAKRNRKSTLKKCSSSSTIQERERTPENPKTPDNIARHDREGSVGSNDAESSDSDNSSDDDSSDDVFWTGLPKGEQSGPTFEFIKIPAARWWEKRNKREEASTGTVLAPEATALAFFSSRSGSPTRFRPAQRDSKDQSAPATSKRIARRT